MTPLGEAVSKTSPPSRSALRARTIRAVIGVALLALGLAALNSVIQHKLVLAESSRRGIEGDRQLPKTLAAAPDLSWQDSRGDGFPDDARLDTAQDRENFTRWFTYLAETQYYSPSPKSHGEVQDCAALVRYAFRNSLSAHSPAWRDNASLPFDPGFGDVVKYQYPHGPLGRALFRSRAGPLKADDLTQGAFGEFADSATLLRYNTFRISRDIRAAQPGDLLFFHQAVQREPFHTMLFVGKSHYQQPGSDWIVYHTGDIDGHRGEIREVETTTLLANPDLHWRPLENNPNFLGVYRLEILR